MRISQEVLTGEEPAESRLQPRLAALQDGS
jgi:hypothetical protein